MDQPIIQEDHAQPPSNHHLAPAQEAVREGEGAGGVKEEEGVKEEMADEAEL